MKSAAALSSGRPPWCVSMRPSSWDEPSMQTEMMVELRRVVESEDAFAVAILFGRPGRGKTTACTVAGMGADVFVDINSSSERRGEELREALAKFHMALSNPQLASDPKRIAVLFIDEADGLHEIGQLTLASFLADIGGGGGGGGCGGGGGGGGRTSSDAPRIRTRVLIACNDLSSIHSSVTSLAKIILEAKHDAESLKAAALSILAKESISSIPEDDLQEIIRCSFGDYRTLAQHLEIYTTLADSHASPIPYAPSHSALPCPKSLKDVLVSDEADDKGLRIISDLWDAGYRQDIFLSWVMQILHTNPPTQAKMRLMRLHRKIRCMTPKTVLQVMGAYVRMFEA